MRSLTHAIRRSHRSHPGSRSVEPPEFFDVEAHGVPTCAFAFATQALGCQARGLDAPGDKLQQNLGPCLRQHQPADTHARSEVLLHAADAYCPSYASGRVRAERRPWHPLVHCQAKIAPHKQDIVGASLADDVIAKWLRQLCSEGRRATEETAAKPTMFPALPIGVPEVWRVVHSEDHRGGNLGIHFDLHHCGPGDSQSGKQHWTIKGVDVHLQ
mmetsp:Transcript_34525/g.97922  ORF Transcript_34525/g.97922 Transcript_34525/m.97922 type:complete len:214 (-) Transcript_34525:590-1231(-)